MSFAYTVPGAYRFSDDGSKNIRVKITFENGKRRIEILKNANNPGGCDKARTCIENQLGLTGQAESATGHAAIEEHITTPSEEQVQEIEQLNSDKK